MSGLLNSSVQSKITHIESRECVANLPKVAILIPILNEEKNLDLLFKSISSQTHKDFVVYIQDNKSDDQSLNIIQTFALQDSRFKVFSNSHRLEWHDNWLKLSVEVLREGGIDYICWLAGDDYWSDKFYLETLIKELQQNPQLGAICPTFQITLPSGEIMKKVVLGQVSNSSLKRIWNLCRDWDNVHHIYGLYRFGVFTHLVDSKISRFTQYVGSDWWWTYNFLALNKSGFSNSAVYVKSIGIDSTDKEDIYETGGFETYLRSLLICFDPEKKHLLKLRKARNNYHLAALTAIYFLSKSMSKIVTMHKEIVLRRVKIR
jgi:glycosyltransferase involved in cell wall biosynthesis